MSGQKSDRRQNSGGIREGGRRKNDKSMAAKTTKRWFILSMFVTGCIAAWAFTLPFRKNALSMTDSVVEDDIVEYADDDFYRELSDEEYVAELEADERKLRQLLEEKNTPMPAPSKAAMRETWEKQKKQLHDEADLIKDIMGDDLKKGSIEWDRLNELKEIYDDKPEWAKD